MTKRYPAWFSSAVLIIALSVGTGEAVRAQQLPPEGAEFILRAPATQIQEIAARHGLTVIRQLNGQDVFLVRKSDVGVFHGLSAPTGMGNTLQAVVSEVEADPDVTHFEVNALVTTPEVASAINLNGSTVSILDALSDRSLVNYAGNQVWTGYVNQPAAAAIRLAGSHAASGTGSGVVAIIDTGVDPDHPLLAGSLVPGYDFVHDVAGQASEWVDLNESLVSILDESLVSILDQQTLVLLNGSTVAILDQATAAALDPALVPQAFGHGTMVAGLVHLVAPTAQIMPLKAFRADGTSTVFDIVRAIYYAVEHGARVINMSFSAAEASPEIAHAINFATNSGVICVASAGNLGQETLVYPGALRNVIGVGSTTSADPPTRSTFSNYGDALVSVGAPGEAVITTYPGGRYAGVWGTSFSSPLTAGGAALLLQRDSMLDHAKANTLLGKADRMQVPGMGQGRLNLNEAVQQTRDATPPAVAISTPATGTRVFDTVLVSASASDNVRVDSVQFLLDGVSLGAADTAAPYELSWPTTTAANGPHTVIVLARDAGGNETTGSINVTVSNDTAAPSVAVTSPVAGSTVAGTGALMATASDDAEVIGVQFRLDGAPLGAEDTAAPYELLWNTAALTNGPHTVTAVARDAAGRQATAASIDVTVLNDAAPPTVAMTSPGVGATVGGTVGLSAAASDDVGVAGVKFLADGVLLSTEDTNAPYELLWNTAGVANGPHTLTAVARDAAGHETTTGSLNVTVANDTTAPAVALTSPVAASSVTGTVTLVAIAIDESGVAGVQFRLDGAPLGPEDTTAPYELPWVTTTVTNGAHTVTAVARDTVGNQGTAEIATVTVSNDTTAPAVALTSPVEASSVTGTVTLVAIAVDESGVAGVQFRLDGAPLGPEDTTAPYELPWVTTTVTNGAYTVTAVARDTVGNLATSASVSVTVANVP